MSAETRIAALACLLLTVGCGVAPLGYVAPYKGANVEKVALRMHAEAPSIGQQFRPPDHLGIDIYHAKGTPVLAADRGEVTRVWTDSLYGKQIEITHGPDVAGQVHLTVYRHLSEHSVVEGDVVRRGQEIGLLGSSGLLAGGMAHLHFEVLLGGGDQPADPNLYWQAGAGVVTCYDRRTDNRTGLVYPVACD